MGKGSSHIISCLRLLLFKLPEYFSFPLDNKIGYKVLSASNLTLYILKTSGLSGWKQIFLNPSASHCVVNIPELRYNPSSDVFVKGSIWDLISNSKSDIGGLFIIKPLSEIEYSLTLQNNISPFSTIFSVFIKDLFNYNFEFQKNQLVDYIQSFQDIETGLFVNRQLNEKPNFYSKGYEYIKRPVDPRYWIYQTHKLMGPRYK